MPSREPLHAELLDLLETLREQRTTRGEIARIERIVLDDPAAMDLYVRYMAMAAGLRQHVAGLPRLTRDGREPSVAQLAGELAALEHEEGVAGIAAEARREKGPALLPRVSGRGVRERTQPPRHCGQTRGIRGGHGAAVFQPRGGRGGTVELEQAITIERADRGADPSVESVTQRAHRRELGCGDAVGFGELLDRFVQQRHRHALIVHTFEPDDDKRVNVFKGFR